MCHSNNKESQGEKSARKSSRRSRQGTASGQGSGQRLSRRVPITTQYPCEICGQYYSRRDNLRVHQRLHSGEMPYECQYCRQRFRWLGALRNHESNHRRESSSVRSLTQAAGSVRPGLSPTQQRSADLNTAASTSSHTFSERQTARPSSSRSGQRTSRDENRNRTSSSSFGSRQRTRGESSSQARSEGQETRAENSQQEEQNVIVRAGIPLGSPIVEEPWHRVLDDDQ